MRPHAGNLKRHLGLLDAVSLFVGIILGSGIFVAPSIVAGAAHGTWPAVGVWIFGGVVCACGAMTYAECAARLPRAGGFFVFYREALGEGPAFVAGWAALTVTYPASIAAIALILGRYVGDLVGTPADSPWPGAVAILAAGAINVAGLRTGPRAQRILTGTKVAALALLCAAALAGARAAGVEADPATSGGVPAWTAIVGAVIVVLWTYDGWSDVTLVAGEIVEPSRNLGRAVLAGVAILVALYALVQVAVGSLLTPDRAAASPRVVAEAVESALGAGAGRLVAALVVVCTFGSIQGVVLTTARLGYAMARDGVFPSRFAAVHPRLETPAAATAWVVAAALVYVFVAGFRELLAFFSFAVWIFYGTTAVALLLLRRRRVGAGGVWRAPGGTAAPIALLATAACLTAALAAQSPRRAGVGLAMIAAGFPLYATWRALRSSRPGPSARSR